MKQTSLKAHPPKAGVHPAWSYCRRAEGRRPVLLRCGCLDRAPYLRSHLVSCLSGGGSSWWGPKVAPAPFLHGHLKCGAHQGFATKAESRCVWSFSVSAMVWVEEEIAYSELSIGGGSMMVVGGVRREGGGGFGGETVVWAGCARRIRRSSLCSIANDQMNGKGLCLPCALPLVSWEHTIFVGIFGTHSS